MGGWVQQPGDLEDGGLMVTMFVCRVRCRVQDYQYIITLSRSLYEFYRLAGFISRDVCEPRGGDSRSAEQEYQR